MNAETMGPYEVVPLTAQEWRAAMLSIAGDEEVYAE